jgi:hypothetical protein
MTGKSPRFFTVCMVFAGVSAIPFQAFAMGKNPKIVDVPPSAADDSQDDSDPVLETLAPDWMNHDDAAIEVPGLDVNTQSVCTQNILGYVNDMFGTEFNEANVGEIRLPGWPESQKGFVRGGAFNIRIVGVEERDEDDQQQPITVGRFMPLIGYLELGAHASLHIPGSIGAYQTFTHQMVSSAGSAGTSTTSTQQLQYDFVAHIDSADPWEPPLGSLIHLFRDVIGASGRDPCPGID